MELGVQSFCFRAFKTNEEVCAKLKECGLRQIELCGVHANFTDEATFDKVIEVYQKNKIGIVSIGVQGLNGEEATEAKFCRFAQRAGAKFMSVDFNLQRIPQALRVAEKLAEQYDLRLAIHNHGGRHWLGSAQVLEWVLNQTSPRIGLCLDTAWAMDAGENPLEMVERFGQRLYGVHVKDFVFDRARVHQDVVVGTGNLDLKKLGAALKKVGFKGYAVFEYEGDVENPVPAIRRCIDAAKAL